MSWDVWVAAAKDSPPTLARDLDEQGELMGSVSEVRARISHCLGNVVWNDPGCGYFDDDDVLLEFNLEGDDPCDGFMISVRGMGKVEHLLARLSDQTGWHLYDCSDGQLLQLDDDADDPWTECEPPRELTSAVWKHVLVENAVLPLLLAALGWSFYISAAVFHFDIVSVLKRRDPQPIHEMIPFTFWCAIVLTVVCGAYGLFNIRRALRLAQHGIEIIARVTGRGTIGYYGQIRVYYEFSFQGQEVRKVMSCTHEEAQQYQDGVKPLVVMCDPSQPRKCMLKSEVLPDSTESADNTLV